MAVTTDWSFLYGEPKYPGAIRMRLNSDAVEVQQLVSGAWAGDGGTGTPTTDWTFLYGKASQTDSIRMRLNSGTVEMQQFTGGVWAGDSGTGTPTMSFIYLLGVPGKQNAIAFRLNAGVPEWKQYYNGSETTAAGTNTNARNIASNVRAPGEGSGALSNGTDTTSNLRSAHFNEANVTVTSLAVLYSGWALDTTNEVIMPNDYTVTAAIEYPSGTYTQVTWSGATSKSITAGSNIISDYVTIPGGIPADARFWVRTFVSVSSGGKWPLTSNLVTSGGNAEAGETGVGLADKTMSGTISGSAVGLRPGAILSQYVAGMNRVSLMAMGDSIIHGSGDGLFDSNGNTSWIGRAATGNCPYTQCAVVGTTLANQVVSNKFNYRLDYLSKCGVTHLVINWGINDTSAGSAAMITNLQNLWGQLRTALPTLKIYHTTVGPRVSSTTNAYYTNAGQTPHSQFNGASANGHVVNDYIRTTPSPLNGYIEYCSNLSPSIYSGVFRNGDESPNVNCLTSENLTASGTPTTTNVPTNTAKPSNWYQFGSTLYTSGVLNGTSTTSGVNNTSANITYSVALSSAPSAGDTLTARPSAVRTTTDGIHPALLSNSTNSTLYGGHMIMKDVMAAVIAAWNP